MKIHTCESYIKGLEEQGIVVYPTMRETILRFNPNGVLDGYPAHDEGLFPDDDPRYLAGHLDREREKARLLEESRALDRGRDPVVPQIPGVANRQPKAFLAKFGPTDRVYIDGCKDLIGIVTGALFRRGRVVYEVEWMNSGKLESVCLDEFRVSLAE